MCCLALIMHQKGVFVSGSDIRKNDSTRMLAKCRIPVFIGHSPANLPANRKGLVVVRSSAIKDDNPEYMAALKAGARCLLRGEFLAELANTYNTTVSVAGAHGKTSVTALISHILKEAGMNPGYMIGGKVSTWKEPAAAGDGGIFVTESDESDGTQVHLRSGIAVVVNVDDDHSWTLGGEDVLYSNFAKFAGHAKRLLYGGGSLADKLFSSHPDSRRLDTEKLSKEFRDMADWGPFQRLNAAIAVEAAAELGLPRKKAMDFARSFPGVERRMSVRMRRKTFMLVEDYAHHPAELAASLAAMRERFPGYRLKVLFQPHRYARLEKYFSRLACELRRADEATIVPVFAAWTEKGTMNSRSLAEAVGPTAKYSDASWPELAKDLAGSANHMDLIAVIGAGDIEDIFLHLKTELGERLRSLPKTAKPQSNA